MERLKEQFKQDMPYLWECVDTQQLSDLFKVYVMGAIAKLHLGGEEKWANKLTEQLAKSGMLETEWQADESFQWWK